MGGVCRRSNFDWTFGRLGCWQCVPWHFTSGCWCKVTPSQAFGEEPYAEQADGHRVGSQHSVKPFAVPALFLTISRLSYSISPATL